MLSGFWVGRIGPLAPRPCQETMTMPSSLPHVPLAGPTTMVSLDRTRRLAVVAALLREKGLLQGTTSAATQRPRR